MTTYVCADTSLCPYCGRQGQPNSTIQARFCASCRASWSDAPAVLCVFTAEETK